MNSKPSTKLLNEGAHKNRDDFLRRLVQSPINHDERTTQIILEMKEMILLIRDIDNMSTLEMLKRAHRVTQRYEGIKL